jgi:hypothetical protein
MRSPAERELHAAAALVVEIIEARAAGDVDENHGNSDDDLLAAIEALERAIPEWEEEASQ